MPMYTFKNSTTGVEETILIKSDEYDRYLQDNPQMERQLSAPRTVAGIDKKPESGFRDVLKRIKKASGSTNTVETY